MGIFDRSCTLYNLRQEDGQIRLFRTVFHGIGWNRACKTALDGGGLQSANLVTVNIPVGADMEGKQYRPSALWEPGCWTMQEGDLLVLSEDGPEAETEAALREALGADRVFAVYHWDDSLQGSPAVQHYRMEAV